MAGIVFLDLLYNEFVIKTIPIVPKIWDHPALWEKQLEAIEFSKKRAFKGVGLFLDCGCGKSRCAIHWIEYLMSKGAKLGFVVAPISVIRVWPYQWHLWGSRDVVFIDLHVTRSDGLREAVRLANSGVKVICLINYAMTWQLGHKRIKRIRFDEEVSILEPVDSVFWDVDWDFGVADESTNLRSPSSKVSKTFLRKVAPKTRCKMIMTGSAYTKKPLDVWAQIKFITGDDVFPGPFGDFKQEYSIPHPYIRGAVDGYKNLEQLTQKLSECCIMIKKAEMVDLPPQVHEMRFVNLTPRSAKIYEDLRDELFAELTELEDDRDLKLACLKIEWNAATSIEDKKAIAAQVRWLRDVPVATAEHIFSRTRKWQQVTSGFIVPDRSIESPDVKALPMRLGTEKLEALYEIMDEREGMPTVIVVQMDEEEKIISEAFQKKYKFKPKILNGGVKGSEARDTMIRAAASDRVFIVKESVAAFGIDIKWCDTLVFYSHSANTINYEQMLSRNHRGGVEWDKITYIHILAEGTYDFRVLDILNNDLDVAMEIERNWRTLYE